ncbi:hypothetical protein, partial [Halorubrum sp. GN12_10-3_MGM]|uniref:hypothetical protein n=1 Tax=Halorubrum sp. GN12_10-3_MGM TaxID=2518113 RepID=UPI001A7E64EA
TGWAPRRSPSLRIIANLCCQFIQAKLCAFYEIAAKSVRAKHVQIQKTLGGRFGVLQERDGENNVLRIGVVHGGPEAFTVEGYPAVDNTQYSNYDPQSYVGDRLAIGIQRPSQHPLSGLRSPRDSRVPLRRA